MGIKVYFQSRVVADVNLWYDDFLCLLILDAIMGMYQPTVSETHLISFQILAFHQWFKQFFRALTLLFSLTLAQNLLPLDVIHDEHIISTSQ
mgnify:CR=1 FL=1